MCDSEVVAGVVATVLHELGGDLVLGGWVYYFQQHHHQHHRPRKHLMLTLLRRPLVGLLVDRQAVLAPNRGWSCLLLRR